MLDLNYVRENLEQVEQLLDKCGMPGALDDFRRLDSSRRELLQQVEKLKATRNASSKQIGGLIQSGADAEPLKAKVREIGEQIQAIDPQLNGVQSELSHLMEALPNLPHESVPIGASENDNRVERTVGTMPTFDFEPKDHADLGPELGILDFERAAKITGSRFVVLVGDGARLERALIQFMLDLHSKEHGYTEIMPPLMVNSGALFGTGQLPKFEEDLFKVSPEDYYLIPTAEVPLTNLHADEILGADQLPTAYCAHTPCFRSEAGSYGKDVRGLIRQHQFNKVELVRFCEPDQSWDALEQLTAHAEEVLKRLELHYRVVTLCTGDLGFSAAKTYDIEVWLPAQKLFREISSCSNFTDFQARRAKIRYRPEGQKKTALVHTLNGSGLAIGRTMVAIMENYQQVDGSIVIPDVLRPYMGGQERIG